MREASANILFKALDDEPEELEIIEEICKEYNVSNYQLHTNEEEFFKNMNSDINLCLVDHRLGLKSGLEITKKIKDINVDNYVIIASNIQDFEVAVAYLNAGADKWLKKFDRNYIQELVKCLREGFSEAQRRIDQAAKIRLLEKDTLESMRDISELAKKLKLR